jgi:hypothetical protein
MWIRKSNLITVSWPLKTFYHYCRTFDREQSRIPDQHILFSLQIMQTMWPLPIGHGGVSTIVLIKTRCGSRGFRGSAGARKNACVCVCVSAVCKECTVVCAHAIDIAWGVCVDGNINCGELLPSRPILAVAP